VISLARNIGSAQRFVRYAFDHKSIGSLFVADAECCEYTRHRCDPIAFLYSQLGRIFDRRHAASSRCKGAQNGDFIDRSSHEFSSEASAGKV
jgi:hypothetical protein